MTLTQRYISAILAGMLVGIASILYVKAPTQLIGAILFSFALLVVVVFKHDLFTGRVGFVYPYEKKTAQNLLFMLFGNFIGSLFVTSLFLLTNNFEPVFAAELLVQNKLTQVWYQTIILGMFCGFLMYLGVLSFQKAKNKALGGLIVVFAVVIFILSGYEHSIANIGYFVLAGSFTFESLLFIILAVIGNAAGAILLHLLHAFTKSA